jgi:hypothetical protein
MFVNEIETVASEPVNVLTTFMDVLGIVGPYIPGAGGSML